MGKVKVFVITLVGRNPVYFAGSIVEGSVILELSESMKMQGISIVLSGQVHIHWVERNIYSARGYGNSQWTPYSNSDAIFRFTRQLWGDGKKSEKLAAGRYVLAAVISPQKHNHITKRAITVNESVDINQPQLTTPLLCSKDKTLHCLWCTSGPISLSVTTDRGGYCPGESIAISVEAENHSNRRVTAVRASLKRKITLSSRCGRSCIKYRVIQRIEGPGIEVGGTSNWSNELLPIPATVPSISSCGMLQVSYELNITLSITRMRGYGLTNLHVTIPITIGNVPFRGRGTVTNNLPSQNHYQPVRNPPPAGNTYPPPTGNFFPPSAAGNHYPPATTNAYPPPAYSYSAAHPPVIIGDDNYTMGETQYAPVYGFVTDYQFAPPPSYSEAVAKVKGSED
ncbi:arrestin domain-containing protein 4-like [Dysidea avara]|uniref:arrestin domain-containing protein 4-like n=1 Tax=Dysidea avara TaxID=196820 RepID=UPI0033246966